MGALLLDKSLIISNELKSQASNTTCFSGYLEESVDAALAVVALRGQRGDVVPAHGFDDVHHGLGLVGVRRDHTGEELITALVTQLRGCGGVTDLGDLRSKDGSRLLTENRPT